MLSRFFCEGFRGAAKGLGFLRTNRASIHRAAPDSADQMVADKIEKMVLGKKKKNKSPFRKKKAFVECSQHTPAQNRPGTKLMSCVYLVRPKAKKNESRRSN